MMGLETHGWCEQCEASTPKWALSPIIEVPGFAGLWTLAILLIPCTCGISGLLMGLLEYARWKEGGKCAHCGTPRVTHPLPGG